MLDQAAETPAREPSEWLVTLGWVLAAFLATLVVTAGIILVA
jgi:hypothetical protein